MDTVVVWLWYHGYRAAVAGKGGAAATAGPQFYQGFDTDPMILQWSNKCQHQKLTKLNTQVCHYDMFSGN